MIASIVVMIAGFVLAWLALFAAERGRMAWAVLMFLIGTMLVFIGGSGMGWHMRGIAEVERADKRPTPAAPTQRGGDAWRS